MGKENSDTRQKKRESVRWQSIGQMRKWEEEMEKMFGELWKDEPYAERSRKRTANGERD